jgi:hypothetical protein
MARIRSVKPEFFTSETIAALTVQARLTFIGLWTYADDAGRAIDNPKLLKAAVWPLDDDVTAGQVAGHLDEFERANLICRYSVDGKRYLHIVNWDEHQQPKNPSKPKYPACPKQVHGGDPPGESLSPDYPSPTPAVGENGDRDGLPRARARSREQGAGDREQGQTVVAQARPIDDTTAIFQAWQEAARKPRARLDDKRRRIIRNALRHYPVADLVDAVRGWRHSPHHCGQNDQRTVYNDLELLLRDSAHIERFRDLERDGPPPTVSKQAAQAMRTSTAMRARAQTRAEEVSHDLRRVGGPGGPAERGLPAPAD